MAHLPISKTLPAALAVFCCTSCFLEHPAQSASQLTPTSPSSPHKASVHPSRRKLIALGLFKWRLSRHKHLIFFLQIIWDSCRVVVQRKSKFKWSARSDRDSDRRSSLRRSISSSKPRRLCRGREKHVFLWAQHCLHWALSYLRLWSEVVG